MRGPPAPPRSVTPEAADRLQRALEDYERAIGDGAPSSQALRVAVFDLDPTLGSLVRLAASIRRTGRPAERRGAEAFNALLGRLD